VRAVRGGAGECSGAESRKVAQPAQPRQCGAVRASAEPGDAGERQAIQAEDALTVRCSSGKDAICRYGEPTGYNRPHHNHIHHQRMEMISARASRGVQAIRAAWSQCVVRKSESYVRSAVAAYAIGASEGEAVRVAEVQKRMTRRRKRCACRQKIKKRSAAIERRARAALMRARVMRAAAPRADAPMQNRYGCAAARTRRRAEFDALIPTCAMLSDAYKRAVEQRADDVAMKPLNPLKPLSDKRSRRTDDDAQPRNARGAMLKARSKRARRRQTRYATRYGWQA